MLILETALRLQTLLVFNHINQEKSSLGLLNRVGRMLDTEIPSNDSLCLKHLQF